MLYSESRLMSYFNSHVYSIVKLNNRFPGISRTQTIMLPAVCTTTFWNAEMNIIRMHREPKRQSCLGERATSKNDIQKAYIDRGPPVAVSQQTFDRTHTIPPSRFPHHRVDQDESLRWFLMQLKLRHTLLHSTRGMEHRRLITIQYLPERQRRFHFDEPAHRRNYWLGVGGSRSGSSFNFETK